MFLTRSQVEELTYRQCVDHLSALKIKYDMELPLSEHWDLIWPILDPLCDTILYLEDRISKFEDPRIASMDMAA